MSGFPPKPAGGDRPWAEITGKQVILPHQCALEVRADKIEKRGKMAQSQPGAGGLPTSERISLRNFPEVSTSSPSDPSEQEGDNIAPPEQASLPTAEPSMASSSPACSNMLTGMCYSTGQGACQQHANTPGDPPFQVGKTRLCSSTHSLPPTADTHMWPSTTAFPCRLGQDRDCEHQEAAERARGSSRNRPAPAPHQMGVRGKRIVWGQRDAFLLLDRAGTSSPYSSSPRPSNSHTWGHLAPSPR